MVQRWGGHRGEGPAPTDKGRVKEGFPEEEMSEQSPQRGSEPASVEGRDTEGVKGTHPNGAA